jgi:hypothetical protein
MLPTRYQGLMCCRRLCAAHQVSEVDFKLDIICCPLCLRGLCAVEYNMVPIRSQGMTCSKI